MPDEVEFEGSMVRLSRTKNVKKLITSRNVSQSTEYVSACMKTLLSGLLKCSVCRGHALTPSNNRVLISSVGSTQRDFIRLLLLSGQKG